MQSTLRHRATTSAGRARARLGLSVAGAWALVVAILALLATAAFFGGLTEDVTQHDGLSTGDPQHLRWFTEHRSESLVSVARFVSEIGSPVALGIVAIVAMILLWRRGLGLAVAIAPGVALAIAAVSAAVGKAIVDRRRPPVPLHLVTETNASFPSGHATDFTPSIASDGFTPR
jgi:membrane-associated phospholipid phosphatase